MLEAIEEFEPAAATESKGRKQATPVPGAIVIQAAAWCDGQLVLETTCHDYDHYRTLPDVVVYEGVECGKTGWSSDRNYACYKSGVAVAHARA